VTSGVYPSLRGKKVIVTGGATGIGAALVEGFARQGSRVAFLDIDAAAGETLAARTGQATFIACDLRDTNALTTAVKAAETALGGVDVLLNNAASDDRHGLDEITPDYWDERIATNLRHLFFAAQAVVPAMRAARGGAIVNFGSISWHLGLSNLLVYQTAKAGIEGLTRSLARELGRDNIRVTTIVPGSVQTPRQARWYTPEGEDEIVAAQCLDGRIQPADVAALALFLASDDGRMCTGHEYFVDAGWR
jgi:NAD(P)-dependent dehydrogenase (short-subunit alcohol dehydrogenase family)